MAGGIAGFSMPIWSRNIRPIIKSTLGACMSSVHRSLGLFDPYRIGLESEAALGPSVGPLTVRYTALAYFDPISGINDAHAQHTSSFNPLCGVYLRAAHANTRLFRSSAS